MLTNFWDLALSFDYTLCLRINLNFNLRFVIAAEARQTISAVLNLLLQTNKVQWRLETHFFRAVVHFILLLAEPKISLVIGALTSQALQYWSWNGSLLFLLLLKILGAILCLGFRAQSHGVFFEM